MVLLGIAVGSISADASPGRSCAITPDTCMQQYSNKNNEKFVLKHFVTANKTDGSPECCAACAANPLCTFWMWNHANRQAQYNPSVCWVTKDTDPRPKVPTNHGCDIGVLPTAPPTPAPIPPPAGAKNVLYLLVDDLRTEMTPYGHSFMQTPHLQALADSALVFEQAHVQSQMCVPTRNSFMTGRRPEVGCWVSMGVTV